MHGLPEQTADTAAADLLEALKLSAGHISWYQLTIERNTRFWTSQPMLPNDTVLESIQSSGEQLLSNAGYHQYEVSAYCRPGYESRHNLNYWGFGDYVGLGAGAHGKLSRKDGQIIRTQRTRSPADYLALITNGSMPAPRGKIISQQERVVEYVMNALRLKSGSPVDDFPLRTGLPLRQLTQAAEQAQSRGWIEHLDSGALKATPLGYQFLDSVVASFL
jgi:oxygen-independent coproporphyrinogen-3 oxidase